MLQSPMLMAKTLLHDHMQQIVLAQDSMALFAAMFMQKTSTSKSITGMCLAETPSKCHVSEKIHTLPTAN